MKMEKGNKEQRKLVNLLDELDKKAKVRRKFSEVELQKLILSTIKNKEALDKLKVEISNKNTCDKKETLKALFVVLGILGLMSFVLGFFDLQEMKFGFGSIYHIFGILFMYISFKELQRLGGKK